MVAGWPASHKGFQHGRDVIGVAGFKHDIQFGLFQRHIVEEPLVIDFDDIAAGLADQSGDRAQHAGLVLDIDAQPDQPALPHQAAHQDGRKDACIDVSARHNDADGAAGEPLPVLCKTAASAAAPAPSTTDFSISSSIRTAFSSAGSSTSRMSETCCRMISRVISPGRFTAMPSAIVVPSRSGSPRRPGTAFIAG